MGKIADFTGVQKTHIDTLPKEAKLQKVIAKRIGCLQSQNMFIERWLEGKSVVAKWT